MHLWIRFCKKKYVLVEMIVGILIGDKSAGHLQDIIEEKEKKAK